MRLYIGGTCIIQLNDKQRRKVEILKKLERKFDPRDELMSVQVVADRLEVSERTIYKYIKEKKLEAVMIGRLWRIPTISYLTFVYGNALEAAEKVETRYACFKDHLKNTDK